jgi:hypothetical protein
MKNIEKNYIGKGRQVGNMDIIAVTLPLKALQEIAHEFKGEMYVSFEVARLQQADKYGKTHTVYQVVKPEPAPEVQEPAPFRKSKGKAKPQSADIPF